MKLHWRRVMVASAGTFIAGTLAVVSAGGQPAPAQAPPMAEAVFKDIRVLKGIPVDQFMDTMGMFAAATAKDCTGCHSGTILLGNREAFAEPTPMIQIARRMVGIMNDINTRFFGGQRRVTCYTCHAGSPRPGRVPNLSIQYGTPFPDNPNAMEFIPVPGAPADQAQRIFSKYIEALGGVQRLATATSFVATGTYAGWDTAFGEVPVEISAKAPEQMTTIVRRKEGSNTWVFDGRNAWFAGVDSAVSNFTTTMTGGNLAGARIEAMVALTPAALQKAYTRWQVSEDLIDDKPVVVLQGTTQGQTPLNLYFDEAGLLVRLVRWSDTAVGPVPTQYDYSDYREVGGVRRPFRWTKTWTNNKATFTLKEIRPNVPIDPKTFARP
jgi:photosynthetic reaction center cytochrome c subunit